MLYHSLQIGDSVKNQVNLYRLIRLNDLEREDKDFVNQYLEDNDNTITWEGNGTYILFFNKHPELARIMVFVDVRRVDGILI